MFVMIRFTDTYICIYFFNFPKIKMIKHSFQI